MVCVICSNEKRKKKSEHSTLVVINFAVAQIKVELKSEMTEI